MLAFAGRADGVQPDKYWGAGEAAGGAKDGTGGDDAGSVAGGDHTGWLGEEMGLATDKPQGEGEEGQADEHGAAWDGDCQGPAGNGGDAGQPEGSDEREGQADPEDGGSGEQYL